MEPDRATETASLTQSGEVLLVTERADDFHVCLAGDEANWECGKTPSEAVGRWLLHHAGRLDVEIVQQ